MDVRLEHDREVLIQRLCRVIDGLIAMEEAELRTALEQLRAPADEFCNTATLVLHSGVDG